MTSAAAPAPRASRLPGPAVLTALAWAALATILTVGGAGGGLFPRYDVDGFLRLVQVRDLLGGQGWFDLTQHRLDPPGGLLMHWSRLVDAGVGALVLVGGERFALIAWPALVLAAWLAAIVGAATALAGRSAALPTLLLTPTFIIPLIFFGPGNIDHHNVQFALIGGALACALRSPPHAGFGAAAGLLCAISLAVGLETLPYLAALAAAVALRWAVEGRGGRGAALFGLALGALPALLHLAAGPPQAPFACDALSWSYAVPLALAGAGLAAAALLPWIAGGRVRRVAALGLLAAVTAIAFAAVAPACLAGPYGALTPEVQRVWLSTVTEAMPAHLYFHRAPVVLLTTLVPPLVAVAAALWSARIDADRRAGWLIAALLLAISAGLGFHQVRALAMADALAVPILGAWVALAASRGPRWGRMPFSRLAPVAFLLATPLVALAAAAVLQPVLPRPSAPALRSAAPEPVRECFDDLSAARLRAQPSGLVVSPVLYGSAVLLMSDHSVLAAPYHRGQTAILAAYRILEAPPAEALDLARARAVDYLAVCASGAEAASLARRSPSGLIARLRRGEPVEGLQPLTDPQAPGLRLWRVAPR